MTFDAILEQVITLLKRQGRVSYRALQRRFDLDDAYIEDLKEEIIEAQRLAEDENGRILVWTSGADTKPALVSIPPAQPEVTQQDQPTQAEPPPPEPPTPDAERRQLTVMFIDIVDSTSLSSQLDPEDFREVVRAYQKVCSEAIQRYDGQIAQLLGDGLLVYFGYPQAHEDDAQRAVRAGLGIVEAIGKLNTRLEPDKGITLAVRLGIHTGLVVVGTMGGEGRREQLALGETPNIAARIQEIAEPDSVVVSAATFHLVEGYFTCQALGAPKVKGVETPAHMYRVLRESGAQSRLDIVTTRGLTPLAGRESEVTLLLERWKQVQSGQGQVVLLSGATCCRRPSTLGSSRRGSRRESSFASVASFAAATTRNTSSCSKCFGACVIAASCPRGGSCTWPATSHEHTWCTMSTSPRFSVSRAATR